MGCFHMHIGSLSWRQLNSVCQDGIKMTTPKTPPSRSSEQHQPWSSQKQWRLPFQKLIIRPQFVARNPRSGPIFRNWLGSSMTQLPAQMWNTIWPAAWHFWPSGWSTIFRWKIHLECETQSWLRYGYMLCTKMFSNVNISKNISSPESQNVTQQAIDVSLPE